MAAVLDKSFFAAFDHANSIYQTAESEAKARGENTWMARRIASDSLPLGTSTLIRELVESDAIQELKRGLIREDGALDQILQSAAKTNLKATEYFRLLASVAPPGSDEVIAELTESVHGVARGQKLYIELIHSFNPKAFKDGARDLFTFLRFHRTRLLNCEGTVDNIEQWRAIKNGFKAIMLANMKTIKCGNPRNTISEVYAEYLPATMALATDGAMPTYFYEMTHQESGMCRLFDELQQYRRDFYVRFKKPDPSRISHITWMHGSQGGILRHLHASANTLVCTGRLGAEGLVPSTGERHTGTCGVNRYGISGCTTDGISRVLGYAKATHFGLDLDQTTTRFLAGLEALREFVHHTDGLGNIEYWPFNLTSDACTLYQHHSDFIARYNEELSTLTLQALEKYNTFKQGPIYAKNLAGYNKVLESKPGEDPGYDAIYQKRFFELQIRPLEEALQTLMRYRENPPKPIESSDKALDDLSLVFATTTSVAQKALWDFANNERLMPHPLEEKEISFVFTSGEVDRVQALFAPHVQVLPLETLEEYEELEAEASKYGALIAGKAGLSAEYQRRISFPCFR
ncbi:MAG: hypothetical protein SP1CHLAM54_08370 [Chlamydiia bacterium]|nr:hypothetical protein [Chlamydiia bacterium]MCH9615743.1 hypothetical protein [Chlamydiia bacterium]MCH9628854.1 hypothetical protein [Chlamydiia bacterium]